MNINRSIVLHEFKHHHLSEFTFQSTLQEPAAGAAEGEAKPTSPKEGDVADVD
jgi:hypothetical protein